MKKSEAALIYLNNEFQGAEQLDIAEEVPLTIYLNGKEMATLLSSPVAWDELALGFLLAEGLLEPNKDQLNIQVDYDQGSAWIDSPHVDQVVQQTWQKRFITSGCSSGSGFYSLAASRGVQPVVSSLEATAAALANLMKKMQLSSEVYARTHGVHGAALADENQLKVFREDVGRHNALDKIRGFCFLQDIPSSGGIVLSTGRVSAEMLLKSAGLQTPIVVSRSAPTTLALEYAKALNITMVGMVRGQRLNVYTVPDRVRR